MAAIGSFRLTIHIVHLNLHIITNMNLVFVVLVPLVGVKRGRDGCEDAIRGLQGDRIPKNTVLFVFNALSRAGCIGLLPFLRTGR